MVAAWVPIDVDAYDDDDLPPFDGWAVLLAAIEDRRPAWQLDAACRYAEGVSWFPERGEPTAPAKDVCETCPAIESCDAYADAEGMRFGIWGGRSVATRSRRRAA